MSTPHGPAWIETTVVPARVAYLIADGSSTGLRRAVQEATTRWGGMTEPIIPMSGDGTIDPWWDQVLSFAGVDALVDVDAAEGTQTFADRQTLPLTPLAAIDSSGPARFTCHPANLPGLDSQRPPVIASEARVLWEVVAAGDVTDEHAGHLREQGSPVARATTPDLVARSALRGTTLLGHGLSGLQPIGGRPHPAVICVTEPDSYSDCLWFWNLRALGALQHDPLPALLLPADSVKHWVGFDEQVAAALARPEEFAPDVAVIGSSVGSDMLDRTAEALGLRPHTGKVWTGFKWPPPPLREPPFTYSTDLDAREFVAFNRTYGTASEHQVHAVDGEVALRFDSPVRFTGGGSTLLRLRSSAFDGYPRRDGVAEQLLSNATWHGDGLQLATSAVNYYRFELHLPAFSEVLGMHLRSRTAGYSLSDKGRLAEGLLARTNPGDLLVPGLAEAVAALTTPRARSLAKDLRALHDKGSPEADLLELATRWGARGPQTYKSAREVGAAEKLPALEALCRLGWAERGFETRCERCGVRSFVPLDTGSRAAHCPGCSADSDFTTVGRSVEIYYRLDTYVDRASDQGAVPQALVAARLSAGDPDAVALPGVLLERTDGTTAEVDLVALVRGKVLAGEVKTSPGDFDDAQLAHDLEISTLLQADAHVLGTVHALPPDRAERAMDLSQAHSIDLQIVDLSLTAT